jgi:hypothetical protein
MTQAPYPEGTTLGAVKLVRLDQPAKPRSKLDAMGNDIGMCTWTLVGVHFRHLAGGFPTTVIWAASPSLVTRLACKLLGLMHDGTVTLKLSVADVQSSWPSTGQSTGMTDTVIWVTWYSRTRVGAAEAAEALPSITAASPVTATVAASTILALNMSPPEERWMVDALHCAGETGHFKGPLRILGTGS